MKRAEYKVEIENGNTEEILNQIDEFFIDLEHKYPELNVSM